ncbi:MAG: HNH endonuclease [Elusimicrobia bacterium]|nr:HNH endonuclease [Elusimicrobiota bacterium]
MLSFLQSKDPVLWSQRARRTTIKRSRYIPRWVKKKVWQRDGGRCVFVGSDGTRCGERNFLQIDHIVPWAQGGISNDPENLRLLCSTHNRFRARTESSKQAPQLSV